MRFKQHNRLVQRNKRFDQMALSFYRRESVQHDRFAFAARQCGKSLMQRQYVRHLIRTLSDLKSIFGTDFLLTKLDTISAQSLYTYGHDLAQKVKLPVGE